MVAVFRHSQPGRAAGWRFIDLRKAVAWKVIRRCAPGLFHPVRFSPALEICLGDDFGNFTERLAAGTAARFAVRDELARGAVNVWSAPPSSRTAAPAGPANSHLKM